MSAPAGMTMGGLSGPLAGFTYTVAPSLYVLDAYTPQRTASTSRPGRK